MGRRNRRSGRPPPPPDIVNPRVDPQHGTPAPHPQTLPGGHKLVAQGTKRAIYYACDDRGSYPAEAYMRGLNPNDQGKFLSKMAKFQDHDMQTGKEYAAFPNGLWEITIWGSRWLGFYAPGRRAFLTHGFEKRRDGRTPQSEVDRAVRIRAHVERSLSS